MTATAQRFLFLQGPHGSFFARLAAELQARGHSVRRINFNGGDAGDWTLPNGVRFTGGIEDWAQFLRLYIFENDITDIVLYGYWRPLHQEAITLARKLGLRVHGFEEGLLRPHWITLDGRLPGEQAADLKRETPLAAKKKSVLVETGQPEPRNGFSRMVYNCLRYYINGFRQRRIFAGYRTHRPFSPGRELWAWTLQVLSYPWRKIASIHRLKSVLTANTPFFLLCLQLDGDSQIRKYSNYSSMKDVLAETIRSFARHAPANAKLVIKNHPLDNGIGGFERLSRRLARENGIAARVVFLNFGKLAGLLKTAQGMITVNSTTGLQALHHECPVKTLGQAAYDMPGLTDAQPLDSFWIQPQKPTSQVYDALYGILVKTSQHPGSFYDPACFPVVTESCLPRLEHAEEPVRKTVARQAAA